MPELPPLDRLDPDAPLRDVAVLEIAGEFSGYAGRLLADLGADVTRLVTGEEAASAAEALFLHRDKQEVVVDPGSKAGRARLAELVAASDVVIQSAGADARAVPGLSPRAVRARNPRAIHAILSPFGAKGPRAEYASTDLVRLAAGGLLWLGGYPDAEPVAPFGGQSTSATAIFGVVAVLLALIDRDRSGKGQTIDVSSQEVLTQALETSIPEYELTGKVRRRLGDVPREAGTGVYPCADGFVSLVAGRLGTAEAWTRLREWLVEEGTAGAQGLWADEWSELPFRQRPESIARFSEIFVAFAGGRSKQDLYLEAQRRSIALAPVNTLVEVLADRQLEARRFFGEARDERTGLTAKVPTAPYRLTPLSAEAEPVPADSAASAAV